MEYTSKTHLPWPLPPEGRRGTQLRNLTLFLLHPVGGLSRNADQGVGVRWGLAAGSDDVQLITKEKE
jgi:hypothetical protein